MIELTFKPICPANTPLSTRTKITINRALVKLVIFQPVLQCPAGAQGEHIRAFAQQIQNISAAGSQGGVKKMCRILGAFAGDQAIIYEGGKIKLGLRVPQFGSMLKKFIGFLRVGRQTQTTLMMQKSQIVDCIGKVLCSGGLV